MLRESMASYMQQKQKFLHQMQSSESDESSIHDHRIDSKQAKYPFCIVWTPIPVLTWLLPMVGHLGIADSKGIIFDFAGPYYINSHELAFGKTSRYIQLIPEDKATKEFAHKYDAAIKKWNAEYEKRMHNLCWDNCHSHVKNILNDIEYKNFIHWNMGILAFWMFFCGKFVRIWNILLPSLIIYTGIGLLLGLI